ncbi:MAG: hypothetical protein EAX96_02445 [Candidatus Lokiarchaeota archaeon]|nr:hypothetical protein [Candidatus Lokiarchaeota archaeon]
MILEELKLKIPDLFEKVKRDVDKAIGRHRAGLSLGFVEMGVSNLGFIGGMFFSGGTIILMNSTVLKVLINTETLSDDIIIYYVYHILLHEYIHSLGFLNEKKCREVTNFVTKEVYEDQNHPARLLAERGIGYYFPKLIYAPGNYRLSSNIKIERIKNFDKSSQTYFA